MYLAIMKTEIGKLCGLREVCGLNAEINIGHSWKGNSNRSVKQTLFMKRDKRSSVKMEICES